MSLTRMELRDGWSAQVAADVCTLPIWRAFLDALTEDPRRLPSYCVLKHSKDRQVLRAALENNEGYRPLVEIVCRHVRTRSAMRWLNSIRGSSARRDFHRASALLGSGIGTARPLAYLERSRPTCESWLIGDFFPEAMDLDRIALTLLPQLSFDKTLRVKARLIEAVAGLLVSLERAGWRHRDLKASNVLILDWSGRMSAPSAVVVDLEGLRKRRVWSMGGKRQALIRLAASLLDSPSVTRTDHARLLRSYLDRTGQGDRNWRRLFRQLSRRAVEYARRAGRRKTHKLDGYSGG